MPCRATSLLLLLTLLWGMTDTLAAGLEQRLNIALSLFPRLVAVDQHLPDKLLAGRARIVLVSEGDRSIAYRLSKKLARKIDSLNGHPLEIRLASPQEVLRGPPPTAVFLADSISDGNFYPLADYLSRHQRLLFSAIPGDVERGAMAGISVTSRVLPYLNMNALKRAHITLHPRVVALSKRYE